MYEYEIWFKWTKGARVTFPQVQRQHMEAH